MSAYAYYALHRLHIRVKDFLAMDVQEMAVTIAFIDEQIRQEKKAMDEAKRR